MSGVSQIVAYGSQDAYLTGQAQATHFKAGYKRTTAFALEAIENPFTGTEGFGKTMIMTMCRNGDLVGPMTLEFTVGDLSSAGLVLSGGATSVEWVDDLGHALIDYVHVEIGGQTIDKHYGEWLQIWKELTLEEAKYEGFDEMIGGEGDPVHRTSANRVLCVPLAFWFNRNPGHYLPLVALSFHEIKMKLVLKSLQSVLRPVGGALTGVTGSVSLGVKVWVTYVYLDTEERKLFADNSHEYLIEAVDRSEGHTIPTSAGSKKTSEVAFSHPSKAIIWVAQRVDAVDGSGAEQNNPHNFSAREIKGGSTDLVNNHGNDLIASALVKLNGQDRAPERHGGYFRTCQMYEHACRISRRHIYMYSFALDPFKHQPSGTLNMSRIDKVQVVLESKVALGAEPNVRFYNYHYNVLKVQGGMGGKVYAN